MKIAPGNAALRHLLIMFHSANFLAALQQKPLQIIAFGKVECNRMIRAAAQMLNDLRIDICVQRGTGDDLLKQLCRDPARAGKGH
jgi:hypothetical protein